MRAPDRQRRQASGRLFGNGVMGVRGVLASDAGRMRAQGAARRWGGGDGPAWRSSLDGHWKEARKKGRKRGSRALVLLMWNVVSEAPVAYVCVSTGFCPQARENRGRKSVEDSGAGDGCSRGCPRAQCGTAHIPGHLMDHLTYVIRVQVSMYARQPTQPFLLSGWSRRYMDLYNFVVRK